MKIVEVLFGSHMYGTNTPDSDKDYKGIFLPSHNDCYLNNIPKSINTTTGQQNSKNSKDDVDREIYSLQYFIKLGLEGQTVAIDMLHAPEFCIIETSDIWKEIVKNREKFYTKNLKAFIGYARKQAAKYGIKGSRLDTVSEVLSFLKQQNQDLKMINIWDKLPNLEHSHFIKNNGIDFYQVCGKSFQSTVRINYVVNILESFIKSFGQRAILAKKNMGIDWKACSHALRAAIQVKELLTTNTIVFPLKESELLTNVKLGNVDYTSEYAVELEKLMNECEILSEQSTLPLKPDYDFWNNFIVNVYAWLYLKNQNKAIKYYQKHT